MSRVLAGLVAATLMVAGCGELPLGGTSAPQSEITVTADRVKLRGPTGFCVDPESSSHRPSQAFIVFGNCAAIAGDEEQPQPFVNAIAVATVLPTDRNSPKIAVSEVALENFFQSDDGRAALSASGDSESVEILDSFNRNGAFFIHARDTSAATLAGTTDTFWRGYFDVKDSLVAVSVLGLKDAPLSSSAGLQTLYDFGNAIMEGQPSTEPREKSANPDDVENTGLLRRLFG